MAQPSLASVLGTPTPTQTTGTPPPGTPSLADVLGAPTSPQTTTAAPTSTVSTSATPVTDEVAQLATNVAKRTPGWLMEAAGGLADMFSGGGTAATGNPEAGAQAPLNPNLEQHPVVRAAAKEIADRLERAAPFMKPNYAAGNTKPLEDVAGATLQAGATGALFGPEAVLPSATSGAMSESARQMGAGPLTQLAVGMAPFTAPSAIRGAVRGGEEGAANMRQNIENANGAPISVGQASGNPLIKGVEAVSRKLPGGGPLRATTNVEHNTEARVNDIIENLKPGGVKEPVTPADAGTVIAAESKAAQARMASETAARSKDVETAVGGPNTPMSGHNTNTTLQQVMSPTGDEAVDQVVTGAKTKRLSKAADITNREGKPISLGYSVDNGDHTITSPNGSTLVTETGAGDMKVVRSDTDPTARGNNEGTARLAMAADVAHAKDMDLVSAHDSVSPAEAAAYEKLQNHGYTVERDPNATVNPATGNLVGDPDTLNPIFKVKKSIYQPQAGEHAGALNEAPVNPWTFKSLRDFRTQVGQAINTTRNTVQKGQLKAIYGAVSKDLQNGVAEAGGQGGTDAWNLFNQTAKANSKTAQQLQKTVDRMGGFGEVFKSAIRGTKDDSTRIAPIMNMLSEDGKRTFQASYLYRLGRKGGGVDQPFDANTYLNNWGSISPEAKDVIFGKSGQSNQLRSSLDSLSNNLQMLEKQGVLKSNLSTAVGHGTAALKASGITGLIFYLAEHGGTAITHMSENHPFLAAGAAGTAAAGATLNPILSRVLTNPKIVGWLAKSSTLPPGAIPSAINQLNRMNDPDGNDLLKVMREQNGR